MHVHIATVGKATEPVIKAFNAIPGIDKVYLLSSDRFPESRDMLLSFFRMAMVSAESRTVGGFDFQEIVDTIYSIREAEGGRGVRFSINITGGTNLMAAAACSCAYFVGADIYYVQWDDTKPASEQLVQIPVPRTPDMRRIKGTTRDVLGYILERADREAPVTAGEINAEFSLSKQNGNYHLRVLRDEGLIEVTRGVEVNGKVDNRQNAIRMTRQGRLVASWVLDS